MIYNELKQHGTESFPVEFYHIDNLHPKYEMVHHWHNEVEIIRILDGELRVTLDNREYSAKKGDVIFVNSETVHGAVPIECVYECIVFNAAMLLAGDDAGNTFIDNILDHTVYVDELHSNTKSEYYNTVEKLFDHRNKSGAEYSFHVLGCLYMLFGIITKERMYSENITINSVHNEKNVVTLKKVLSFMRKSFDTQITLADIADSAGISPKYLCTFFKEMTDMTPFEYLNIYRVERAARRLISTDLPVTQIAYTCGFNDLSYFIKTFKNIKGVTPKNFRKNVKMV